MGGRRKEPTDAQQRALIANACFNGLKLTMPFALDDMAGSVEKAYVGWPNRIYVMDTAGKVVMKGRRGPQGVDLRGAEAAIKKLLGAAPVKVAPKAPVPAVKDVPDGTYTGTADGHNGPVTVEIAVKGGKLTSVTVQAHKESVARPAIAAALKDLPARIVARQGASVDAVSKATGTSKGIMAAVENALRSAVKK